MAKTHFATKDAACKAIVKNESEHAPENVAYEIRSAAHAAKYVVLVRDSETGELLYYL